MLGCVEPCESVCIRRLLVSKHKWLFNSDCYRACGNWCKKIEVRKCSSHGLVDPVPSLYALISERTSFSASLLDAWLEEKDAVFVVKSKIKTKSTAIDHVNKHYQRKWRKGRNWNTFYRLWFCLDCNFSEGWGRPCCPSCHQWPAQNLARVNVMSCTHESKEERV